MEVIQTNERSFVAAGHENPMDPGVWKKVLFRREDVQTGLVQMVNWARLPVGRSFAAHYHEDMQEIFVIVQGIARIVVDCKATILQRGDAVRIDAREVHQMWNDGAEDVEYVVVGITSGEGGQTVLIDESTTE